MHINAYASTEHVYTHSHTNIHIEAPTHTCTYMCISKSTGHTLVNNPSTNQNILGITCASPYTWVYIYIYTMYMFICIHCKMDMHCTYIYIHIHIFIHTYAYICICFLYICILYICVYAFYTYAYTHSIVMRIRIL